MLKWLLSIPNLYLHFGDLDLAGIGIYLNEYKRHLDNRASFFVPDNIEATIVKYGNRTRYNSQKEIFDLSSIKEERLLALINIIHKHKKGLDQEVFIKL